MLRAIRAVLFMRYHRAHLLHITLHSGLTRQQTGASPPANALHGVDSIRALQTAWLYLRSGTKSVVRGTGLPDLCPEGFSLFSPSASCVLGDTAGTCLRSRSWLCGRGG